MSHQKVTPKSSDLNMKFDKMYVILVEKLKYTIFNFATSTVLDKNPIWLPKQGKIWVKIDVISIMLMFAFALHNTSNESSVTFEKLLKVHKPASLR